MIWVLILIMHVGPMGDGNSNSLTTQEFTSEVKCKDAGEKAKKLVTATTKKIEFVCVEK